MATKKTEVKKSKQANKDNPNSAAIRALVHTIFIEAIRLKDPDAAFATKYVMDRYVFQDAEDVPVFCMGGSHGTNYVPLTQGLKWWIKTEEAAKYANRITETKVSAVDYDETHAEYLRAFALIIREKEPGPAKSIETLAAHSIAAANVYFFRAKVGRLGPVGFAAPTVENLIRAVADQKRDMRVNVSGEEAAARYPLSRRIFIVELKRVLDSI